MFLLLACAAPPYTQTQEACQRADEDCDASLLLDLGADPGRFQEEDLDRLLTGERELLTWDLGPWPPEMEVHAPFREALEWEPGQDAREKVYNFVADHVDETVPSDPDVDFAFFYDHRELQVRPGPYQYDYASSLFHEASHAIAPGHLRCPDQPSCDDSWAGAYGMQVDVLTLALRYSAEDPENLAATRDWASSRLEIR